MTKYQRHALQRVGACGVEVVYSADDGGWYAVVFSCGGEELYTTDLTATSDQAWGAAVDWCDQNRPADERIVRI